MSGEEQLTDKHRVVLSREWDQPTASGKRILEKLAELIIDESSWFYRLRIQHENNVTTMVAPVSVTQAFRWAERHFSYKSMPDDLAYQHFIGIDVRVRFSDSPFDYLPFNQNLWGLIAKVIRDHDSAPSEFIFECGGDDYFCIREGDIGVPPTAQFMDITNVRQWFQHMNIEVPKSIIASEEAREDGGPPAKGDLDIRRHRRIDEVRRACDPNRLAELNLWHCEIDRDSAKEMHPYPARQTPRPSAPRNPKKSPIGEPRPRGGEAPESEFTSAGEDAASATKNSPSTSIESEYQRQLRRIPLDRRTPPYSLKKACELKGWDESETRHLSEMIRRGEVLAVRRNRQSYIFDKHFFYRSDRDGAAIEGPELKTPDEEFSSR